MAGQAYIYLASRSPRRRELLDQIGVDHQVLTQRLKAERGPDVYEDPLPGEQPRDYVLRVCRDKVENGWMRVVQRKLPLRGVLAADTTVCLGDEILGTPADAAEAADFLDGRFVAWLAILVARVSALERRKFGEQLRGVVRIEEIVDDDMAKRFAARKALGMGRRFCDDVRGNPGKT